MLNFYLVRVTSKKFGLHAGNEKFNRQNEKWINVRMIAYRSGHTVCGGSTAGTAVSNPAEGMNVLLLCVL